MTQEEFDNLPVHNHTPINKPSGYLYKYDRDGLRNYYFELTIKRDEVVVCMKPMNGTHLGCNSANA